MRTEENQKVIRLNPEHVPAPVGRYSHVTIIPKNADLYTFSGQIGIDCNGTIPNSINEQVTYTFANIEEILKSQGLSTDDVIKVNIWATEEIDWEFMDTKWDAFFGKIYPSMTIAYVTALGLPELKIEIEIWAAKR
ncbi:RidA family protein [Sphingobacterium yanglingense]|uniref:Enamine deaminase RidA (YjgF/YER057c/UK114 family) n=1 Tax=Sphingobacterium yanglingense TaxID=1437280 RepID=A0A4R6W8L4_9SPHI|nr:RidA family protein [Sphingobacterium yanglingense]TDQ73901.1 enamine deaminase RidA (YjgF/YER057c/UK114 family) [Sphingobacterium yanglingense]